MDPKKPNPDPLPPSRTVSDHAVPDIDERANQAFLDALVDTDGRPMSEAIDMPEDDEENEDGIEDEDDIEP